VAFVGAHDPATPYDLPGGTPYAQLSAPEKASVDAVHQTVGLGQPDTSFGTFSRASGAMASDAKVQIAARAVGLVDTSQDGVIP